MYHSSQSFTGPELVCILLPRFRSVVLMLVCLALPGTTTVSNATSIADNALGNKTTGSSNTASVNALQNYTSGSHNTAAGSNALDLIPPANATPPQATVRF